MHSVNQKMPALQRLIEDRAATVERCRSAIRQATLRYRQSGAGSATLLQALYLSRECHAAFLRSVASYNRCIASYALTVRPQQSEPLQIVAMLIPAGSRVLPGTAGDSGLRHAAAPQPGSGEGFYRQAALPHDNVSSAPGGAWREPAALSTPDNRAPATFNSGQSPVQPGDRLNQGSTPPARQFNSNGIGNAQPAARFNAAPAAEMPSATPGFSPVGNGIPASASGLTQPPANGFRTAPPGSPATPSSSGFRR